MSQSDLKAPCVIREPSFIELSNKEGLTIGDECHPFQPVEYILKEEFSGEEDVSWR